MFDDRRGYGRDGEQEPLYAGMRLTADQYLALPEDGFRYEVIDGVVVMSPSPTPEHQDALGEIALQLRLYARISKAGRVYECTDVKFADSVVYCPDLAFFSAARMPKRPRRLSIAPDLVVEVLSPRTERRDETTKLNDYEKFGVLEYWLVDPRSGKVRFLRRNAAGKLAAVRAGRGSFASLAVPGFVLDLKAVRQAISG